MGRYQKEIADRVGYQPSYLIRQFKKSTGLTPRRAYIVDVAEAATIHYRTYGGGRKNERSKEAVRYADRSLGAVLSACGSDSGSEGRSRQKSVS